MKAEDLAYMIAKLRSPPPRPLALWFVDRPEAYYELLKERGTQQEVTYAHQRHELSFYGIPLRTFCSGEVTKEELETKPHFCKQPGVWIEMSDGNHVRLQDEPVA